MCGIAGLLDLHRRPISPVHLNNMGNAIAHRGPDGSGQWIEESFGLSHRRLAILDLSPAGHQPMISFDHRWVISYNGEIYNFRELKLELEAAGYWFRSESDTEVVLYAFAHWGVTALEKFNGMFALALWDRKSKSLLLARDRYGIKPLYYSFQNGQFAFASEQKSITVLPTFDRKLNIEALYEYFTFQNILTSHTLLQDINILPAGTYLQINLESKTPVLTQYWDFQFTESLSDISDDEYTEELTRLFAQAVNRQLVSDVELGAYLSGGMDSGSITAFASKSISCLKTFTCGFDLSSASGLELGFDERARAEAMSAYFKTEHYQMVLKAGDMERCLNDISYHLEEPRVGQCYPNFYAAKLTSKFVNVVLSGTGGDELFGGYPWRYYRVANSRSFDEYIHEYYQYWQRLLDNTQLRSVFKPVSNDVESVWTRDIFRNVFTTHNSDLSSPVDFINHSLYFEAKTFLHGLFIVEDKLSMSYGLESRVPFMDNDLVDFAMKCPVRLKLRNLSPSNRINENNSILKKSSRDSRSSDGKQILRRAMEPYIPDSILSAKKQGFSSPDASWFRGESIDFVKKIIYSKSSPLYQFMDYDYTTSLVSDHMNGKVNRRLLIWSLLYVDSWMKSNI